MRLAERRSYEVQFSVMDKVQVGASFRGSFLNTYNGERVKAGVVGRNSHFRAVKARLIKYSIIELYVYIRILAEARVFVAVVILWLWGRTVNVLDHLPP